MQALLNGRLGCGGSDSVIFKPKRWPWYWTDTWPLEERHSLGRRTRTARASCTAPPAGASGQPGAWHATPFSQSVLETPCQ
eukprot:5188157-Pyramimonas_sp.AAC.1